MGHLCQSQAAEPSLQRLVIGISALVLNIDAEFQELADGHAFVEDMSYHPDDE